MTATDEAWRAVEFGEVGVSFSFTVWTLVSWTLTCFVIFLCASVLRNQRRYQEDLEAMVALLATVANENSALEIPETRRALRTEMQRRGWHAK